MHQQARAKGKRKKRNKKAAAKMVSSKGSVEKIVAKSSTKCVELELKAHICGDSPSGVAWWMA